jgi:dienelactone hydrolase
MRILSILLILVFAAISAKAEIHTETIEYKHGNATLEGYLAYDTAITGKRPGVLVIHEWTGLGDYVKMRTVELAKLGYVAFALDMYGKGIRPQTPEEAGAQAKIYRVIGYCFGGGCALELARSGADIAGVVSFHGNLDTPNPEDAKNIRGEILVCQGGSDPYVPQEQLNAFWNEMKNANVNYQLNIYGGAVHSFTNPASGNDPSKGAAYNEQADKRSWQAMRNFFDEIFK